MEFGGFLNFLFVVIIALLFFLMKKSGGGCCTKDNHGHHKTKEQAGSTSKVEEMKIKLKIIEKQNQLLIEEVEALKKRKK